MRLDILLQTIVPISCSGPVDLEITGLCYDSRQAKPGSLFFALRGAAVDGHCFIGQAVAGGAVAVVLEDGSFAPPGVTVVTARDARHAMSMMAARFYHDPTAGIPCIGITGTNGKTTTTYLMEGILAAAGIPSAVLGTISYRFGNRQIPAPNTTPESVDLQGTLAELVTAGARGVIMEVSSHALEQRRVDGCRFDVGIFSNLTRDHLDYHLTMENYLGSKSRLFSVLLQPTEDKPHRRAVVNVDDEYGERIAAAAACPVVRYGLTRQADVTAREIAFSVGGIGGVLVTPKGEVPFHSRLLGRFNLYNILSAVAAGVALDLPLERIVAGIAGHATVPGRLERVENDRGFTILVDYAHTGDALENVLLTLKEIATGRIITVFGCGGDRDKGKRPVMGGVAGRYSDLAILTSDNPRTEDPATIMAEVRGGLEPLGLREYRIDELAGGFGEHGFVSVPSRRDAIGLAVRLAQPGDVVLLAGKGHEDYQIIGTVKHHFDDREEAAAACAGLDGL